MFTGIVRELGTVDSIDGGDEGVRLVLTAPRCAPETEIGASIALNGCCLTAETVDGDRIAFQAVPETLRRTSLGRLRPGDRVNVEPAVRAGDPLGGHYVQGHVDGLGRVQSVEAEGVGLRVWIEGPPDVLRYCVPKGSVAVEGVSLTIAEVVEDAFGVALIPHTLAATTLAQLVPGWDVNLEADVLAKYVERLVNRP
ncbi:MAG TPA: riboflavin synthase [Gaiellaceae bacterium]